MDNFTRKDFDKAGGMFSNFTDLMSLLLKEEKAHAHFLTKSLTGSGQKAGTPCNYRFPVTKGDPAAFSALARLLEGIGNSAYLGAAKFISNKTHLTDAGAILSVETRHSATLNLLTNSIPYPNPFDIPLVFDEVYSLAAPFIASCPDSNPPLPVKALPTIKISPKNGKVTDGAKVTVKPGGDFKKSSKGVSSNDVHGAFITAEGPKWVALVKSNDDEFDIDIPRGLHGLNYFVINKGKEKVTDETVLAGPAAIQVMEKFMPMTDVDKATVKLEESL